MKLYLQIIVMVSHLNHSSYSFIACQFYRCNVFMPQTQKEQAKIPYLLPEPHNKQKSKMEKQKKQLHQDSDLIGLQDNVQLTWIRLVDLLPVNSSLNFSRHSKFDCVIPYPTFLSELALLSPAYYKSLIRNSCINKEGRYTIATFLTGEEQLIELDDFIPVSKDTKKPLWGLEIQVPWVFLILKAWSKLIGGIQNIHSIKPFEFIRNFTFPNWKHYFLSNKDTDQVTDNNVFHQIQKQLILKNQCYILAKTKNNHNILHYGLQPDCLAYKISFLRKINSTYLILIQSSVKSYWCGIFSVIDHQMQVQFENHKRSSNYEHVFIISWADFLNLFSTIYISPFDYSESINGINSISSQLSKQIVGKQSIHYQIQIKKQGFIDFFLLQNPQSNVVQTFDQEKFYRFKILIIRPSNYSCNQTISDLSTTIRNFEYNNNACNKINQYPITFDTSNPHTYDYNRTQNGYQLVFGVFTKSIVISSFSLKFLPGKYIIHIKGASLIREQIKMKYYFGAVFSHLLQFQMFAANIKKNQKSLILRSLFLRFQQNKVYLDLRTKLQWIIYGATFDTFGYGFLNICTDENSQYAIYCEFDSKELQKEGYKCKDIYKLLDTKIGIYAMMGRNRCIVLKKCNRNALWPPLSIKFYKVAIKKENIQ